MKPIFRKMTVKAYHETKGDSLVTFDVAVRPDRIKSDPFFAQQAAKVVKSRRLGKVVEFKVDWSAGSI